MWFDDNVEHTCLDCKRGNYNNIYCEKCIYEYCVNNVHYSQWVKDEERGLKHDLLVLWHARFREVFTHCKSNILAFAKRISSDLQLWNFYGQDKKL